MCAERKRVEGELIAWQLLHIGGSVWGGLPQDLDALNPYRQSELPKTGKSDGQIDRENRVGWGKLKEAWVGDGDTLVMDVHGTVIG